MERYKLGQLSVAIVDDHELVLEGFSSYMRKHGVGTVETFALGRSLLARAAARRFDAYIIDVELTDMEADLLIDELRALHPDARIVINTMHEEVWVVRRMMQKQVDGVIYKSGTLEQLIEAICAVMDGRNYFCPKFRRMLEKVKVDDRTLTTREQDVLRAIARGLSSKEIAGSLYISENTVETHRQRLFTKLGAHNMAELIMKGIAAGYLEI